MRLAALCFLLTASAHAEPPAAVWRTGVWRGQIVTYQVADGWAVVEHDILLARVEEIAADPSAKSQVRSAVVAPEQRRWPDAVVYYVLDSGLRNPSRVADAMRHWEERTPFRFVQRTGERNYVRIRSVADGCSATVGMAGGEQFVNLGDGCGVATTIHELGHTLGLWHTQSRIDRDRHIRVRYENIDRGAWGQYDMRLNDGEDVGPYDYGSIMHYSNRGFARGPGPTIQSIPLGIPLGSGASTSPNDAAAAYRLAERRPPAFTVTSTPPGLRVVVDGQETTTPAVFNWSAGETHRLSAPPEQQGQNQFIDHLRFVRWNSSERNEIEITVQEGEQVFDAQYQQMVRLELPPSSGGTVRVWPEAAGGLYPAGTQLLLVAEPVEGQRFHRWNDNGRDGFSLSAQSVGWSANPLVFRIDRNLEIAASFTARPLTTVQWNAEHLALTIDNARVFSPAAFDWPDGSVHTIIAPEVANTFVASIRHSFGQWSHGQPARHEYTATPEGATLTATYRTAYSITARSENLRIDPPSPDGWFDRGQTILLEGLDNSNGRFLHWGGDLGGSRNPEQITVEEPVQILPVNSNGETGAFSFVHDATRQPGAFSPGQSFVIHRFNNHADRPIVSPHWEPSPLPVEVAGLQVSFDEFAAPLLEVGPTLIRGVVPEQIAGRARVSIRVFEAGQEVGQATVPVLDSRPGVYARRSNGIGDALVWNEDWTDNTAATPARPYRQFHFLATGLGLTEPPEASAQRTGFVQPTCNVGVELGYTAAEVVNIEAYNDLPPGVFRIWARVPGGMPAGRHMLFVTCGGRPSRPGVWVYTE